MAPIFFGLNVLINPMLTWADFYSENRNVFYYGGSIGVVHLQQCEIVLDL